MTVEYIDILIALNDPAISDSELSEQMLDDPQALGLVDHAGRFADPVAIELYMEHRIDVVKAFMTLYQENKSVVASLYAKKVFDAFNEQLG